MSKVFFHFRIEPEILELIKKNSKKEKKTVSETAREIILKALRSGLKRKK